MYPKLTISIRLFCPFLIFLGVGFYFFCITAQSAEAKTVLLSAAEQNFIQTHPEIALGVDKSWEPYVFVSASGDITGVDNDILSRINQLTGANFKQTPGTWKDLQKQAEARVIDGLSGGAVHAERSHYLNFSKSHFSLAVALLVAKGNPQDISTLEDLNGKTIVYRKGNMTFTNLAKKFPTVTTLEVDTFEQVINSVVEGRADATFGTGVTIYMATKHKMPFLQVAYPIDKIDIVYGVRNDWPEAITILNKGIDAIPRHEIDHLLNKWSLALYIKGFDYTRLWKYIGASVVILLLFGYRYMVVNRYNKQLKQSENRYREMFTLADKEKKIAEKALAAERDAIQQNINFIDMISHEYRTPLTAINGSIDILEDAFPVAQHPALEPLVAKMRISSARLLDLFESELHKKRINATNIILQLQPVDLLADIIEVAVDFTRHIYPEHHLIIDDTRWQETSVEVDKKLLVTALTNILDNSCKYSEASDVLVILDSTPEDILITVKDSGVGIADHERERVVEKYYRSDSTATKPGAGVGLFLTKKIVELHNGTLTIETHLPHGTEITISLPRQVANEM